MFTANLDVSYANIRYCFHNTPQHIDRDLLKWSTYSWQFCKTLHFYHLTTVGRHRSRVSNTWARNWTQWTWSTQKAMARWNSQTTWHLVKHCTRSSRMVEIREGLCRAVKKTWLTMVRMEHRACLNRAQVCLFMTPNATRRDFTNFCNQYSVQGLIMGSINSMTPHRD